MADDIVTRLRNEAQRPAIRELCMDAAEEIVWLRAVCADAREFIDHGKNCDYVMGRSNRCSCGYDYMWKRLDV